MTNVYEQLKEPFQEDEIEWRIMQSGKKPDGKIWAICVAYVQARAIQDRLDKVVGPDKWRVEYVFSESQKLQSGVICKLSLITFYSSISGEYSWTTKEDGSEQTDMEAFKGGLSSAFKRTASVWGIGRYLYNLETPMYATIVEKHVKGAKYGQIKDPKEIFYWTPPKLPDWALPQSNKEKEQTKHLQSIMAETLKVNIDQIKEQVSEDEVLKVGKYVEQKFADVYEKDKAENFSYASFINRMPNPHPSLLAYAKYVDKRVGANT